MTDTDLKDKRFKENPMTQAEINRRSNLRRGVKNFSFSLITAKEDERLLYEALQADPNKKQTVVKLLKSHYKID